MSFSKTSYRRLFGLFRFSISLWLIGLLLRRFDWTALLQMIQRGQWIYLVGSILCFFGGMWLSGLRWQTILQGMSLPLALRRLLVLNLEGLFWSNFLPSTIGGDGYRFLKLSRFYPDQRAKILSSVFLDRLYGYLGLLGLHLLILPFLFPSLIKKQILVGIEGLVLISMVGLLFFLQMRHRWIAHLENLERGKGVWRKVLRVLEMMAGQKPHIAVRSVFYSSGFVVLNAFALWFGLRVLEVRLPVLSVFYASTLSAIVGALPLSLNGLGLMEWALVFALSPLGVLREEVLFTAFMLRGINVFFSVLGGMIYLFEEVER